jgi:predicted ABC-type ATPase
VATRVRKGGHTVPQDKILERRLRSFAQFGWFFDAADTVDVYDNSGATPQRVLAKRGEEVTVYDDLPDEMLASLETVMPGFGAIYEGD